MQDVYTKELMLLPDAKLVIGDSITVLCGDIEFYGDTLPLKIDFFTTTPYVTIEQDGEMIDMPILPGDVIGMMHNDGYVNERVFNGKYRVRSRNEYTPFGMPLEYFTLPPKKKTAQKTAVDR